MNINYEILYFLNGLVNRSPILDGVLRILNTNSMFAGGIFFAVIWFLWFLDPGFRGRLRLLVGVGTAVAAGVLGRVIQLSLPFHARPLNTPALHLHYEIHLPPGTLGDWSSFPSDHATVCFGLAALIFCRSRWLGLAMFSWAVVVTGARVALGMHYPIDIAAGAVLGTAAVTLSQAIPITVNAPPSVLRLYRANRPLFYFAAFWLSFELSVFCADFTAIISIFLHKI